VRHNQLWLTITQQRNLLCAQTCGVMIHVDEPPAKQLAPGGFAHLDFNLLHAHTTYQFNNKDHGP
jgi:hypothetical protein